MDYPYRTELIRQVDLDDLAAEVYRLGWEYPGHQNEAGHGGVCFYRLGDAMCIVGTALNRLEWRDYELEALGSTGFRRLLLDAGRGDEQDSPAARFIGITQLHQDVGLTWGEAVQRAADEVGYSPPTEPTPEPAGQEVLA